jgi:mannitol/fructose-specific phosphotransferase system IIA component
MSVNTEMLERGEDQMTDFQFKTIIKMVLAIARKTTDVNTIIKELERLLPENERTEQENKDDCQKQS